ncbi:uncharacterized protein LOC132210258 [Stegostoma tigrinum]|uniref:uncharacterized protein LOC132210258 n=1 Tax=Stegostoma tigrinum TaxID=3053191 RepID=UPI002870098D|nr:uncharacterized protein LOC132210258 [Stegostoma tigrinum]
MPNLKKLPSSLRTNLRESLSHCNSLVISSALKLLDHVLKQTRYHSHITFLSTCLRNQIIPKGLQSTFQPSQFGPNRDHLYTQNIQTLQKRFSLRVLKQTLAAMRRHLQALQSSLPQLRASLSQTCKGPLLFFILRRIHRLNTQFHSALLDTKNPSAVPIISETSGGAVWDSGMRAEGSQIQTRGGATSAKSKCDATSEHMAVSI